MYDEFDRDCIETAQDGTLLVSAMFPLYGWGAGYLLTYGTEVEIVEPLEAKKLLAEYVRKIYLHHET